MIDPRDGSRQGRPRRRRLPPQHERRRDPRPRHRPSHPRRTPRRRRRHLTGPARSARTWRLRQDFRGTVPGNRDANEDLGGTYCCWPRAWMAARRAATWSGLNIVRRQARLSRASISQWSSSAVICAYVERIWRTPGWSLPMMSSASRRVGRDQVGVRHDVVDEPEGERFVGEHEVAGEAHLPGPADADGLGQQHRESPARHHADAGVRVAELGVLAGDEEVTVERQLEPAGDGDPVDRTDQRLADPAGTARGCRRRSDCRRCRCHHRDCPRR